MNTDPSQETSEPVKSACGGTLKSIDGWPRAIYHGKLVYFCSESCFQVFQRHPDDFLSGKIDHPIE